MRGDHSGEVSAPTLRSEVVAVVGLGKIGLPLAVQYANHGRTVIGCDVSAEVVATINAGKTHNFEEPGIEEMIAGHVRAGRLSATADTPAAVGEAGVVVVIVPVLVNDAHDVDYRHIISAATSVGKGLKPGTLVMFETTLPVGTTRTLLRETLEAASGLVAGRDFYLAYSPERVSSGVVFRDLKQYPKIVGGYDAVSGAAAEAFYSSVLDADVIRMQSMDDAEFVKLIETTYRDVNIALANEYARFADTHGLNAYAAIAAANTQPYSHIHAPGVGVGGHCIPVYPYFLISGAADDPTALTLPRRSRIVNDQMADYAADRVERELGKLDGAQVLLLGVAYRGDVRETAFTSARLLRDAFTRRGATIYASDPLYSDADLVALGYTPLPAGKASEIQAIVAQAAHEAYKTFDLSQFPNCHTLLDGRNVFTPAQAAAAGMRYLTIGDGQESAR
ncbi:MAG: nucleotide sugar dehydrogenase [Chloroflexota bacterium]|nr:nucleotide sugar dehydrogenase [Chloroflexota bacterium]